jgi:hypothetical protein
MRKQIDLNPILKLKESEAFQSLNEADRINLVSSNPHLIAGFNKVSMSLLMFSIEKDISVLKSVSETNLIDLFTNDVMLELINKLKKITINGDNHLIHILKKKDFSSVVYYYFIHSFYRNIKRYKIDNPYLKDLIPKMKKPYIVKLIKSKSSFFELIWQNADYELFSSALKSEFTYYENIYQSEVLTHNEKFELYLYALNFAKQNGLAMQFNFFPMVNASNIDECLDMVKEKQEILKKIAAF